MEVAKSIAEATYKDASGVEQPSPNKWQAVYILGQIFDARRDPAKALVYYKQVAERFTDAALAVADMTSPGEARDALRSALRAIVLAEWRRFGATGPESLRDDWAGLDFDLNADGLLAWCARRAR